MCNSPLSSFYITCTTMREHFLYIVPGHTIGRLWNNGKNEIAILSGVEGLVNKIGMIIYTHLPPYAGVIVANKAPL